MKKVLVIDNYDSFTYNLVHYLEALECTVEVLRNDEIMMEDPERYDKLLLSPGPGVPKDAGLLIDIIRKYAPTKSILGVCLGQQAIGEAFGGSLLNPERVYHGIATKIDLTVTDENLYEGMGSEIEVGRYHSWCVDPATLPDVLEVTAVDKSGQIMSLRHRIFDVKGVQFHPESILTPHGKLLLQSWLNH
ncbi:MAG: aminodeoxychorismate/anthranilate synthase component II [Flavobacterium sp.]|nr:MAG: aminodeoxychorismate/anthranilate synthase component II [Flavobacterium sp.]